MNKKQITWFALAAFFIIAAYFILSYVKDEQFRQAMLDQKVRENDLREEGLNVRKAELFLQTKTVDQTQKLEQLEKQKEFLMGYINNPPERTVIKGFGEGIIS